MARVGVRKRQRRIDPGCLEREWVFGKNKVETVLAGGEHFEQDEKNRTCIKSIVSITYIAILQV